MLKHGLLFIVGMSFACGPVLSSPLSDATVFTWDQSDYGISFSLVGPFGAVEDFVHQGGRSGHVYLCRMCRDCVVTCDKLVMARFAPKEVSDSSLETYTLQYEPRFKNARGLVVETTKRISLGDVPALLIRFSNTSNEPAGDLPSKGKGCWLVADANGLRYKILAFDMTGGDLVNDAQLGGVFKTLKITDMQGRPPPIVTDPPRYKPIDFNAKDLTTFGVTLGEKLDLSTSRAAKQQIIVGDQKYPFGTNNGIAEFTKALDGSASALEIFAQYHEGIIDEIHVVTRNDYFFKYLRDELNRRTTRSKTDQDFDDYTLKFGGFPVRISLLRASEGRQAHIYFRRDDLIQKAVEAYQCSAEFQKEKEKETQAERDATRP